MRKLLTITLMTIAFVLNAKVYNPNTLPVDLNKINYSRVINPDAILSQETVNAIDTMLLQLQRETGVQAMVIAITNIENDDPFQFTFDVYNKYGVGGKETNTGFVLTLATLDRSYQIVTGKGLEGTLPDAICKRIENREMVPFLKKGNWDMAMYSTVKAIKEYIEEDKSVPNDNLSNANDTLGFLFGFTATLVLIGLFIIPMYVNYKKNVCKVCKKHSMTLVSRKETHISKSLVDIKELWRCTNCGYEENRTHRDITYQDDGGSSYSGGSYRSSHSSGSFSGFGGFGGFGGGCSGGGGAGGRF